MAKGSSGKDYTFGSNGSITVSRPDGSTSTVNKGDSMYDKTVSAMGQDGVKYPSSNGGSSNKPSSSGGSYSSGSSSNSSSLSNKPSYTGSGGYQNNIVPGTGGMTQSQYNAEVMRKKQAGQQLTNPALYNAIGKKPYVTSDKNKEMYGNNNSTHIMKTSGKLNDSYSNMMNVKDGYWKDHQYDFSTKANGYIIKDGRKISLDDAKSMQYIPKYFVDANGNKIETGGTLDSTYFANTGMSAMNNDERLLSQRSDKLVNTFGEGIKHDEDIALKQEAIIDQYRGMSDEQLQSLIKSGSHYEKNIANYLLGNMKNDESYNIAPIAFAPEQTQQMLSDLVYEQMRQNGGIENFAGISTLLSDQVLNQAGLGGLFDINQVNDAFLLDQLAQAEDGKMMIDGKQIMDAIVEGGGLKEGYTYNQETGEIGVDQNYVQMGDILVNRGEAFSGYGYEDSWGAGRARNEDVTGQMYEEPLEWRAKYNPDSMTDEMKEDLQMERDIKSQLEELTLQLQFIDEIGAGGAVGGAYGVGGGSGAGSGNGMSGNGSGNSFGSGGFGNGGSNEFIGVTGGGRNAEYRTQQNYDAQAIANQLARLMGGGR